MSGEPDPPPRFSFLTSHGRALAYIAANPEARLRDIAAATEITERRAVQVVNDLEHAGFLKKTRAGRRNHYIVVDRKRLRRPSGQTVVAASQLLTLLLEAFDGTPFS